MNCKNLFKISVFVIAVLAAILSLLVFIVLTPKALSTSGGDATVVVACSIMNLFNSLVLFVLGNLIDS